VTTAGDWGTGQLLYILFEVQDTGCGLTHEEKQILFQRFKQASPRTHAQYGGSGLGLFISKHLTELHGGQIGVASEAGLGSRFALYVQARRAGPPSQATQVESQGVMPIERQLGDDAQLTTLSQSVTPQRQDYATSGHGAGLVAIKASQPYDATTTHILVVEDNLINQRVLAGQLKKAGCKVNVANDGVEALEFLAKTKFCVPDGAELSVILMDLEMPNMDGLTCVRRIRQMEQEGKTMGHIPVIAVTANVRDEQVETARRAGMDDVVSKPFRIPDLLKKIEVLLKGT
jgi:CheY-like chemotaxis protein